MANESKQQSIRKLMRSFQSQYACLPIRHGISNSLVEVKQTTSVHPLQFVDNPKHITKAGMVLEGYCLYRRGTWEYLWSITKQNGHLKISCFEACEQGQSIYSFVNGFTLGVCTYLPCEFDEVEEDEEDALEQAKHVEGVITELPAWIAQDEDGFCRRLHEAMKSIKNGMGSIADRRCWPISINGVAISGIKKGPQQCEYCFKCQQKCSKCARCKAVRYCDHVCQKADWTTHKLMCFETLK